MSSDRVLGRVKWFNNRAGYGFITITDGSRSGTDIFVHHSSVKVDSQQYKYLVQGEYVEFTLLSTPDSDHEFQASDVSGVRGGQLMCETRNEVRESRLQMRRETQGGERSAGRRRETQGGERSAGRGGERSTGQGRGRGRGSGRGRPTSRGF
jgi:cold shock protein